MHFTLAKKGGFVYAPQAERQNDLVAFTQLRYGFGTDFTDMATLVPTIEVIRKQQLFVFLSYGTEDVFVHNVRFEIRRYVPRINQLFASLLYVLHQVYCRVRYLSSDA